MRDKWCLEGSEPSSVDLVSGVEQSRRQIHMSDCGVFARLLSRFHAHYPLEHIRKLLPRRRMLNKREHPIRWFVASSTVWGSVTVKKPAICILKQRHLSTVRLQAQLKVPLNSTVLCRLCCTKRSTSTGFCISHPK